MVARAAYLLELAYFVHCCNKNHWPSLVQFAPQHGCTPDEPDTAPRLKHKVSGGNQGVLLYNRSPWMDVIGTIYLGDVEI